MYTKILVSKETSDDLRAIVLRSHHSQKKLSSKPRPGSRKQAEFGSKSYNDALQRAFNRAKTQIYFNPDMQYFVTLTYEGIEADPEKVMADFKAFAKRERRNGNTNFKYAYVLEWQKRGSLHVHAITNKIHTYTNKNGHQSVSYWRHGIITSCLHIKDFDTNFKPYLYLFKYMRKAERIGKTFIHSSRNLNNFKETNKPLNLLDWTTLTQEYTSTKIINKDGNTKTLKYYKNYLKHDMLPARTKLINQQKEYYRWQKVLLHSTKALQRTQRNLIQH